ncbi:SGNH/GDSL hydrolase family protein [Rhizobium laguerreae]|uniref:SGNH/GDSL hydrolase family protein n=1 Tax=Rhizobium laguerreae TaxID=1076926 RepID=UPI001441A282|nr:SGNH/GDSL hydrolase family protein [Rhizobium laguerreae]MBY3278231.1 SGNH/GDSL hydrolase family protein [Rhizobium laguerreae]NKM38555.1 SGNH/GDSL hydrolase family protein [Rhizobium laguerreae]NNH84488.1 SGNH/GDSL hydrolase family protein [Rhizobium laguerreae]
MQDGLTALALTDEQIDADIEARMQNQEEDVRAASDPRIARTAADEPKSAVAVGDSWFDYPFANDLGIGQTDVIAQLDLMYEHKKPILRLAHYGDATTDMMTPKKQERLIKALKNKNLWVNGQPNAIFCSAGGNDVAGNQFRDYLNHNSGIPASEGLQLEVFNELLVRVKANYETLFELRDTYAPAVRVIGHSYDFPTPDGRPVDFFGLKIGPWLKPSLDLKKWNPADGKAIVADALIRFRRMLEELESNRKNKFQLVKTQGTLVDRDYTRDWKNELHPTSSGFKAMAKKFDVAWRRPVGLEDAPVVS